jgi:serine/threonine protein kinase
MISIVERMLRAIKEKDEKFLQFGDFKITKALGHGQQGMVVLAQSPNKKSLSIKLYSPTDENQRIIEKGKERFIREANILLSLSHRNIANVYLGGSAKWDGSQNEWLVSTDFSHPGEVPYYVMDYVKGDSVKSLFYSGFYRKNMQYRIDSRKGSYKNLNLFEELVIQVSNAMKFFHDKGVVHRDIKPDNVIYSAHDENFVIVDFGFARHVKKGAVMAYQDIIVKKPYIDLESEQQGTVDHLTDQYMFAKMLLEIIELFKPPLYTERYFKGLKFSLERAASSRRNLRYANMEEFRKAIEPYLYSYPYQGHNFQIGAFLIPIRRFGHFFSKVRIPVSGSVPLCREILEIIDTTDFQRLRGVRQLGPCHFVYPGANHTRFEHSIGAYYLALRYLEVLLKNPHFYEAVDEVEEAIKLVVLASLLHDIGHYPNSCL